MVGKEESLVLIAFMLLCDKSSHLFPLGYAQRERRAILFRTNPLLPYLSVASLLPSLPKVQIM